MGQSGIKVADKIYFDGETAPYTVKAFDGRRAICTKPFNLHKTVLYTIVDFKEGIRSTNDLVFNDYDYSKQEDIDRCMADLKSKKVALSERNAIQLKIEKVHRRIYEITEKWLIACVDTEKFNTYECEEHGIYKKSKDSDDGKCIYCGKVHEPLEDIEELKKQFSKELNLEDN
jgi:hypothetical protein